FRRHLSGLPAGHERGRGRIRTLRGALSGIPHFPASLPGHLRHEHILLEMSRSDTCRAFGRPDHPFTVAEVRHMLPTKGALDAVALVGTLAGLHHLCDMSSISSDKAPEPVGHYPHARRVGDLLFLSGVGPRERGTRKIPGVELDAQRDIASYDIETQCRSVFQ